MKLTSDTKGNALSQNARRSIVFNDRNQKVKILNNAARSIDYSFYVQATTAGGVKAYKKIKLEYKVNKPPEFKLKKLPNQVITIGDTLDEKTFKYTSPEAEDFEKDKVIMKFKG